MSKAVILDTNLLLLLIVGLSDPDRIGGKRLREYNQDDFEILKLALENSSEIVVSANTLSETSNLLRQIDKSPNSKIALAFRNFIQRTREIYIESATASKREEFFRLGLSDNAILEIAKKDVVILSADLDLYLAASVAGYDAINFNHLRAGLA